MKIKKPDSYILYFFILMIRFLLQFINDYVKQCYSIFQKGLATYTLFLLFLRFSSYIKLHWNIDIIDIFKTFFK